MERSDSGWGRSTDPAPRWRALLDRALLGRSGEQAEVTEHQPARHDPATDPYPERPAPPPSPDPAAAPYGQEPYGREAYGRQGGVYGGTYTPQRPVPPPRGAAPMDGRQRQPSPIEWRQARPDDDSQRAIGVLRRDLGRPRVLAFANPKGGVHKTTATALAAATIGSVRGRGVLAWDDNELRGTLGLRAGSARHARTIRHLVSELAEVESYSGLELTDRVDDYLRHASDGTYDVLAGEENPKFAQKLDQHTVRRVLELLCRTHDLVAVDTGNNVESPNWRTVLQAADQLVVTSVPREDAAFTADWMLDLLHEIGLGELANDAVTLLSCATPGEQALLDDLHAHFAARTRAVVVVPYDPALESGSAIEPAMLQPATKQAWLHACSVIMEPLVR